MQSRRNLYILTTRLTANNHFTKLMESSSYTHLTEFRDHLFISWSLLYLLYFESFLHLSKSEVFSCTNCFLVFYPMSFESKSVVTQIKVFVYGESVWGTQIKLNTLSDDSRVTMQ